MGVAASVYGIKVGQGGRHRSHRGLQSGSLRVDRGAGSCWPVTGSIGRQARKPASFVGKYELGERRLDIVELMVVLKALSLSFDAFWAQANVQLPDVL